MCSSWREGGVWEIMSQSLLNVLEPGSFQEWSMSQESGKDA